MIEKLNEAYEELKRVDHLIYVSLKYTRTVDVILNILARTVDAYAFMVDALIEYAKEQEKITSEPESAIERAELIAQLFAGDELLVDNMQLYLLERKLLRARNIERENEYRRHVTLKTVIEGREEIVNIDIITNYYLYQREFLNHVRGMVENKVAIEQQQEIAAPAPPAWMTGREDMSVEEEPARPSPQPRPSQRPKPSSAGRKRAPRPKKYKIQVPKGKNPILRAPYEAEMAAKEAARKEKRDAEKKAKAAEKKGKAAEKKAARPQRAAKQKKAAKKAR
jgi:hypothetical protein